MSDEEDNSDEITPPEDAPEGYVTIENSDDEDSDEDSSETGSE